METSTAETVAMTTSAASPPAPEKLTALVERLFGDARASALTAIIPAVRAALPAGWSLTLGVGWGTFYRNEDDKTIEGVHLPSSLIDLCPTVTRFVELFGEANEVITEDEAVWVSGRTRTPIPSALTTQATENAATIAERDATIAAQAERMRELEAGLRHIQRIGTRSGLMRTGDAWADAGWSEYSSVSEEAEYAALTLATLSPEQS